MKKKLTVFEASCIITGYGIGSGVLAMPYIANKCGYPIAIIVILLSFLFSLLLHLMIADLSIKNGSEGQIINIIDRYLPKGKAKTPLKIILFTILAVVLYTNLAVYISGAAEILNGLLGIDMWLAKIIFYIFAAIVAIFGIKVLGICEKYAMYAIFLVIASLVVGSLFNIRNSLPIALNTFMDVLSFLGVSMFAFVAFFSVPQVVEGLEGDKKKVKKSIFIGMAINMGIMLLVITSALLSSVEITEVSMMGWSKGIGLWAEIIGSVFTIIAMLTTYWSISMALKDIVHDALKINPHICFIIASIPSLLIAFIPSTSFLSFLELAAGAIAILIAIFMIPIFHISRKEGESILGKFACIPVEIAVFVAYILMAVGSLI